jgi:type VI secretion system secreted protein VgrG
MADFAKALAYVLAHEGGWADDPADPGGATNYGITLKTARRYGIADKAALRAITKERVAEIYEAGYWRFGDINDQRVATKLFDMAVNMGMEAAVKVLQRGLWAMDADVIIDGALGPATLAASNMADPDDLLGWLCSLSAQHYGDIVARRPASAKFLKGWLRRAAEVPNA